MARGNTLREQSLAAGVALSTLVNAEDGEPIRLSTARKLAEHYGRPLPDLFPDLIEQAGA